MSAFAFSIVAAISRRNASRSTSATVFGVIRRSPGFGVAPESKVSIGSTTIRLKIPRSSGQPGAQNQA